MQIFKKAVALIVVILCVIGILVCVGGIAGSWFANRALTDLASNVLTPLGDTVSQVNGGIGDLGQGLGQLQEIVANIEKAVAIIPGLGDLATSLRSKLDSYVATIANLQDQLGKLGLTIDDLKANLARWIDVGTLVLDLLLVWIAIAQVALLRWGWQTLRAPRPPETVKAPPTLTRIAPAGTVADEVFIPTTVVVADEPHQAVSDQAVSDQAVSDQAVSDQAVSDQAGSDQANIDQPASDHPADDIIEP